MTTPISFRPFLLHSPQKNTYPYGDALGIDLGLEKFLTTSDREFIARPRFYETDRDYAASEVIRLRGLDNLSTQGLWGIENAYTVGLPGIGEDSRQSRSKTKSRQRKTRNTKS